LILQTKTHLRASAKKASQRPAIFRIEGESVTYAQIGERLGIASDTARLRMARLRLASGAVTWQRLRGLA
jgi:DNA-directed RNA polymerase specialized sigma24 family protein